MTTMMYTHVLNLASPLAAIVKLCRSA